MPQIVRCPNIEIGLYWIFDPIQLPIEDIAQWLNEKTDRIEHFGQKKKAKFLKICLNNIENISGMGEHLIEVLKLILHKNFKFKSVKNIYYFFIYFIIFVIKNLIIFGNLGI